MKRTLLIVGGVLLLVVLAAGAYMAGRLINKAPAESKGPWDIARAAELPTGPADAIGFVTQRVDSSFFIGTGHLTAAITGADGSTEAQVSMGYDGPVVEVVVNKDTTLYRNATDSPTPPAAGQTAHIEQAVMPGSLDEITTNMILTVWGDRSGDRIVARVLMYSDPMLIKTVH